MYSHTRPCPPADGPQNEVTKAVVRDGHTLPSLLGNGALLFKGSRRRRTA